MSDFLTSLGINKSKTLYLIIEDGKTSIEFEAGVAIKAGRPVKLNADGTLALWLNTDALNLLVGYTYSDVEAGEIATVFTRGYAVIYAMSAAAADAGLAAEQGYNTVDAIDGGINTDQDGLIGYPTYDNNGANTGHAWILDQAVGAHELIRVLLMH